MRVLQINTVCGKSSTGRITTDLASVIEKNGGQSLIVYGRNNAPDGVQAVKFGGHVGQALHVLKTRVFDLQGFGSWYATGRIINRIMHFQPDIIHLHNLHGSYIHIGRLFAFLYKVNLPIVWTLHDCWPFTGHCVYYDYVGCSRWKTLCSHCPRFHEYPKSIFLDCSRRNYLNKKKLIAHGMDITIIPVSDWLAAQVRQSFLKEYSVQRIYNGINLDVFRPVESDVRARLGIANDRLFVLGVSDGWSKRKGFSHMLKLAENLGQHAQVVLVGVSRKTLTQLPSNVMGIERTDHVQQLVEMYSAADVLVNPSYEETFGLVTAEALACGTPVVVFDTTACPELVDETCGIVVQKGDDNALLEGVLCCKLFTSTACRARAQNYDKQARYQDYYTLYLNLLQKGKIVCVNR